MPSMEPDCKSATAVIMNPHPLDVEKAQRILAQSGDYFTTFEQSCTSDYNQNLSVAQALKQIKCMCEQHQKHFAQLCQQLKEVATVMLGSQEASDDEANELGAFFDMDPSGIKASSASPSFNDIVQAKCKRAESEKIELLENTYYHMQICITCKNRIINMYYASVTAREFAISNLWQDKGTRARELAALKVRTQDYLANKMVALAPHLAIANEERLRALT